jgi:hypothetical protein
MRTDAFVKDAIIFWKFHKQSGTNCEFIHKILEKIYKNLKKRVNLSVQMNISVII